MEKYVFSKLIGLVIGILCLKLTDSQCTWPTPFVSSTWRNNARGDLVFATSTMSGWSFTVGTEVINEWQCVSSDQFDSDGYLVLRSVNKFIQFVTSYYYAYLCLKLAAITDVSYRVYIHEPKQPNLDNDRFLIHTNGGLAGVTACLESYGASGSEYQVLVKSGSEVSASITCPWIFLGRFDYSHMGTSGSRTCSANGDNWDLCTDKTKMAFDFTSCDTDVAYSALSDVYCLDTVPVGGDAVVTVYTQATVDGSSSFSFACFALSSDLSEASVAPEFCREGMTSFSYPVDKHGSQVGAIVTVTDIYELCPTCPTLTSPDGGSVAVTTDGPWTIATYSCIDNYALYGDTVRTCQQNDTWSGAAPTCMCIAPASPDNGLVAVSSDGSLATYSCDVGFVLKGNQVRICQTDGNAWNGTDPTCETCSVLDSPANGAVSTSQQGVTTLASFTCDVGYTLDGAANITCLINGTWSNNSPTCVLCSTLTTPNLSSVTLTTDGQSTSASFTCATGYQVRGSGTLTCDPVGSWNGTTPTCICETAEAPGFGAVSVSSDGMTSTFTCNVGYSMDGAQTSNCQLDGSSWDTAVPACVACTNLTTPVGGNFTMTTNGTVTMVTYSCNAGYNILGKSTLSCDKDGAWSETPATCVLCETLEAPASGSVAVSTDGRLSTAVYTCVSDYVLTGTGERTCQGDGTWNGTQPQCDCLSPSVPNNGEMTVMGDLATFTCDVNYTLAGEAVSACNKDGTGWNASEPVCVMCNNLQSPVSGSVTFVSLSGQYTEAVYSCDSGYTMSGSPVLACLSDGTWNATAATCVECQVLQTVNNGSVTMTTDGQTTIAAFSCDEGFTLGEGYTSASECGVDGTWTEDTVSCTSCVSLEEIPSGQATMATNGTVTMVTYTCVAEYYLVGSNTRYCLSAGTWTDVAPDCVCDVPGRITSGTVSESGDGLTVYYSCDTGYTMNGTATANCRSDGTGWSTTPPTCGVCQSLPDTSNGTVTLTSDGTTTIATYTCETGYSINGTSVRSCQTDGGWTQEPPNCALCASLTPPASGSYSLSYNDTSTQAQFTCVTGYAVVGPALLTCQQDGSWDSETPTCVCEAPAAPANGSVSVSDDGYSAVYSCDTGYTLDGTSTTSCQTDGQSWSGQAPVCVGCLDVTPSTGSNVSLSSNGSVTQLLYTCGVGYTLSGTMTQTCGTDSQWSGTNASCTSCDPLFDPASGSVSRSSDGTSTTAVYTCSTGYYLQGDNASTCSTDGTWTSPAPTCVCVPPTAPTNGSMMLSTDNITLTFTCDTGYILSVSSVRLCQTDGSGWSGSQPSCTTCAALSTPNNGTVTLTSDGATTMAQYSCNLGFSLNGTSTLTCGEDGSWNTQPPLCVGCPALGDLASGSVDLTTNGTTSVAAFTCVSGYSLSGTAVIVCLTSGLWDGEMPTCLCDAPDVPVNGLITLSADGMEVSYYCAAGTTLSGSSSRKCAIDGTGWQGTDPQCVACPVVMSPDGGAMNEVSDGLTTLALFTCDLGYSISGASTLTCTDSGSWDNSQPTCAMCATLSSPSSGSVVTSTDTTVTTAEFTCVSGYTLDGSSTLTCLSDGTWDTEPPSCVCNPPPTPNNGGYQLSTDGMTVTYTCDTSYTLLGVVTRDCQTDGSGWNEQQPSCTTCDPLDSLVGGDITMVTTGTVTQANFTCDAGYSISGDTNLTCRSDGTWDITAPTCQVCDSLSSPTSGFVTVTTDGSTSTASYMCNTGYTLSGPVTLTCRTDGSWDFAAPTCARCTSLTGPDSGSVSMATNGTITVATFTCATGYYLEGETNITCGSDGNWNLDVPTCVCEPPEAPTNGTVMLSADKQRATFTCGVGNTLVGSQTSLCASDGTGWTSVTPTCVNCPALSSVDGGSVETVTNGTTTVSSVTCSLGSSASGSTTIVCGSDGTWTDLQSSCVQCPAITSQGNGSMDTQTNGTVTVAVFSCDVGYTLSGDRSTTCLADGSWDNQTPTCAQCESLADIPSGTVVVTTSGMVTMATYSCAEGYHLSGDKTIACQQDGSWNSTQPECICDEPVASSDGSVWVSPDGMSAVSSCDIGFTISGHSDNICTTNGTGWLYTDPVCVQCQPVVSLLHGNSSLYTDGTTTYTVYTCQEGYSLGSIISMATCEDTGQWDHSSMSCVECSSLTAPTSGSVLISTSGSSSLASYSCLHGYSLHGNSQRTCMTDGTWNGTDPACVCNSPASVTNGAVEVYSDQLTASYTCDSGYTLDGVSERQCADDGNGWTETSPACVICETLVTVVGGSVGLSSDGLSTTALVACGSGYTMLGSPSLQCRSDGSWNISTPQCVLCESLTSSSTGSYGLSTDGQSTVVTFECGTGYTLSGAATASCTTAGTWSQPQPTCVSCASLSDPDSGSVTLDSNGTVTKATFLCTTGYHIVGESVLYCADSGSWNTQEPTCVCDEPLAPDNGTVTLQDGGYTAVFTCTEGYSLSGSTTRTCSTSGSGWNGTETSCVYCDQLTAPSNGSLVTSTDGTTSSVTVGCNVGYTVMGSATLTCQIDGTYDFTLPECVECSALQTPSNGSTAFSSTGSVTMATISCDLGYTLAGNQILSCLTDGSWSETVPECVPCAGFPDISSGSSILTTNTTITIATIQCVTGYFMQGQDTVHCTQTGAWTDIPACLCEAPASPANGDVSADGVQATYTCSEGYTLSGNMHAMCLSDGTGWDNTTPSCVVCESQSAVDGGTSHMFTNGSSTSVTYSCPVGYTLDGEPHATCGGDGTWSTTVPSCSQCEALETPDSGLVAIETDNATTTATYNCVSGYDLIGVSVRSCLVDGTWSDSTPSCACSVPEAPLNGAVAVSSDRTTVSYSCTVGYTITGVTTRTCQAGGAGWTGDIPTCTACSTLSTPSGGNVVMATEGTMTTTTFSCSAGYTMDGERTLACRDDGSWNTSSPTCVLCDSMTTVSGGDYSLSTNGQVTSVQFRCDQGYTLSGSQQLSCLTSGNWNGQAPVCTSCPTLVAPDSGQVEVSTNTTTTTAVVTCESGYYLSGPASLTCLNSGDWDSDVPECLCTLPSNITSGFYTVSDDRAVVTYSCLQWFTLDGSLSRTCQTAGLGWPGSQPTCVQCPDLGSVNGGTSDTVTNGSVTMTTYQCGVGSTLYGETSSECTASGTWTTEAPTCVSCTDLKSPSNGSVSVETNGTVTVGTYACDVGYTMDGTGTVYCQTDGTWSTDQPTCTLCQSLGSLESGSVSLATDGATTMATYSCASGYQLSGTGALTCRTDSTWDRAAPTCVCTPPLSLVNGNYTISAEGMSLTYSCNVGYTMTGLPDRSCDTGGAGWSGSPPACVRCETLTEPDNGAVTYTTDGVSTVVTYTCGTGYAVSHVGAVSATCTEDGSWNTSKDTTVSCVACPTLDTISNGNITMETDGTFTLASYECLTDYSLSGNQLRACVQGQWNGTQPTCLCSYSTYFPNGQVTSDGSVIAYSCDPGYTLSGTATRVCQDGGQGWSLTQPSCVVCETLSVPGGGNMTLATDGMETVATLTCDLGYTMTGQSQLTCRTDGTWSASSPSCGSSCTALSQPSGGAVTMATTGLVTTALFTCDVTYTLVGVATLTCRNDGSWDFTQPSCVSCGSLSAPASGYVEMSTDGPTSFANYSCHYNYYLDGPSLVTCLTSGSWSSDPPTCICNPPASVANGTVQLSEDEMTADFTCLEGFTLSGSTGATCQTDYTGWSPYTAQCVTCGDVPETSNRTAVLTSDGLVSSVTFTCDLGYTISGKSSVSCTETGAWDTDFPDCVSCSTLESTDNGSYALSTDGATTAAQFTCDLGFSLKGDNLLTCFSDGSWSTSVPECVLCPYIDASSSGSRSEYSDGTTTVVSFMCATGYYLLGDTTLACQTDGTWNGSKPVCLCDKPDAPVNGVTSVSSDGMTATYICNTGYTLYGKTSRQCSGNGTRWLDTAPSCAKCEDLASVVDGGFMLSSDGALTVATYSCGSGYTISGPTQVVCNSDGTWDLSQPTCVSCSTLDDPANGHVTIETNGSISTAVYTCDSGYDLQGQTVRSCSELGSWDGEQPLCICETPASPVNGDVSSDGTTASYTCDVGYTLYGGPVRSCQDNSLGWNGSHPTCNTCSSLGSVSGGSVSMVTDGTVTSAVYICREGYTVSGSSTITCRSDGSWDFTETSCVSCQTLSVPSHGTVALISDGSTTTTSVACDPGYTLSGTSLLTCKADGSWDFSVPSCVACPILQAPVSGYVNISTDSVTSIAEYSCVSGYHSDGGTTRTCDTDGVWSGLEPNCRCDSPTTPSNGGLVLSAEESVATFTCDTGYSLVGTSVLQCLSDGTGWNGTHPTCVSCNEFDPSFNGTVTMMTDGQTTAALLTCDLGSTLTGSSSIACQEDGTWRTESALSCVTCADLSGSTGVTVTMETNGTETVTYFTCDEGYTMDGEASVYCTNKGEWSGAVPSCVLCSAIDTPTSGSLSQSTDGYTTVALVTCAHGYHLVGSNLVTCQTDGTWSDEVPTCVCDPPASPANGQYLTSTAGDVAQFSCDVGFTLEGAESATCVIDGSGWNNNVPYCVTCASLANISDGLVTMTTNGSTSLASYSCDAGFSLHGNTARECIVNGSWTSSEPECVHCPLIAAPDSGFLNVTTDGTISTATYSCMSGYILQGEDQSLCYTDATWSSTQPTCVCQLPAPPNNGLVTFGSDSVSVAEYSCDVGYTLQGTSQRHCQNHGSGWNSTAPICVTCATLTSSAGAVSATSTDGTTTSAQYSCDLGYTMLGSPNLTCRDDGTWDRQAPTCVTCATLSSLSGGEVTLTTDAIVTQANISCSTGYTISGATTLTCRSDSTWDFSVPSCVQCPSLSSPFGGTVAMATDGHMTTASYTCMSAYYLEGASGLTCEESGNWSDEEPLCKCTPPAAIPDGAYLLSADGYSVTYTCDSGFSLSGDSNLSCLDGGAGWSGDPPTCSQCDAVSSPSSGSYILSTDGQATSVTFACDVGSTISGQSEITCQPNGSWEFTEPVCVQCTSLDMPVNGYSDLGSNGSVSETVFKCDQGYTLSGESVLTCLEDGTWSSTLPTCVSCPTLSPPSNGAVVMATSGTVTMATFSCDAGYNLIGSQQLSCTAAGSWNTSVPTCDCDSFADPANGDLAVSEDGTTAQYSCDTGYTLLGEVKYTCKTPNTGTNTSAPSCVTCATLSDVPGSTITVATDGTATYATAQCDTGYTIIGQRNLTCRSDGTWDFDLPNCVVCDTLDVPDGGRVTLTSADSVTLANVTCDLGYTLRGASVLTCRTDASWDYTVPTCSICPSVSDLSSGTVTLSTDGHVTSALYSCVSGYYLDGAALVACNTSGLWESEPPTCKCEAPPEIDNGTSSVSADGSTVHYSCELGFRLEGNQARSCDNSGNWWDGELPRCVKCDDVGLHENGTFTTTTDGVATTALFYCNQGFTLNGAATLSCLSNGSWDDYQPTCDYCSDLDPPANGSLTYQTNSTVTTALIQCETGFTSTGSREITCLTGGSWDTAVPSCVQCPVLSSPANGDVAMTTNGSVTLATYTCESDYILIGNGHLFCSSSGVWSEEPPSCECEAFVQLADGSLVVSEDGMVASYSCEAGYSLSGDTSLQCAAADTFIQPSCARCLTLTSSGGSSYTLSTDGSVTVATYSCNTGYTMIGQSTLSCHSDGSWDREAPSCVTCSTLDHPVGASVNFTSSGEVTLAQFTCDNGYSLVGANTLTCRTDGSWDVTAPICMQCPTLSDPSAGHVAMTTDGYTSVADYTCMSGYYLDGAVQLTCNSSGLWDSDPPSCKCSVADTFTNGSTDLSANGYSVMYSCSLGYSLNGTANMSCDRQGSGWSGEEPNCVLCDSLSLSANLSVLQSTDDVQTVAMFSCGTGYSMSGVPESTCLSDGSWSQEVPSCVLCTSLETQNNITATQTSDGTNTVTSYQCEEGFTMAGEATLTCDSSGTWSSAVPDCVICPSLPHITNGIVTIGTNGTVTIATHTCDLGYSILGYPKLLCTTAGLWDQSEPECVCDDFTSVSNGVLSISEDGTVGTYICDEGYTMSGEAILSCTTPESTDTDTASAPTCVSCDALDVPAGSTVNVTTDGRTTTARVECGLGYVIDGQAALTCRADGTWDVVMPTCVICSTLSEPVGGAVTMEIDGSITVAKFTCDAGYTLSGSTQLTCRTDGSWDLVEPSCVACPNMDPPNAGSINLTTSSYVSIATFSCSPGYDLDGAVTLTCLESGAWNGTTPVCKCEPLPSISNGTVSLVLNGFLAVYSCQVGYTLSGATNRSCDQGGAGWLGEAPSCVKCIDIAVSSNMTSTMATDGSVSIVTYECDLGYSLNGEPNVACETNGNWTEQQPTCELCADLVTPANGSVALVTNGTLTVAEFTCDLGYTMKGQASAVCQTGGGWSAESPHCERCLTLTDPSNGHVAMTTNGTVTMATFTCTSRFSITGDHQLYCESDGVWSSSPPSCSCDAFIAPSHGDLSVSDNGTTATYTCDLDYTLSGDATQTCEPGLDSVECVLCGTLPTSEGSGVQLSTDGTQTTGTFTCDTGYKMVGEHTLKCRTDGTWDMQPPICAVCATLDSPTGGTVVLQGNGYYTQALYSCVPGFTLDGQHNLTCKTDGTWDFQEPTCVCDMPSVPANGQLTLSGDSLTAEFSCEIGYSLSGDTVLYCDTDGSGWQGTEPSCVACPVITVANSVTITLTSDGIITSARVLCDHGYTLSDTSNITCLQNGSWSTDIPSCVACPSLVTTSGLTFQLQSDGVTTYADFSCASGYAINGASQITCSRNASWDMSQPTCVAASVGSDTGGSGAGTAVAIVFAILFAIAVALLLLLAWRFWKLREQLKTANKTNLYKTAPKPGADGRTSMMSLPELDEIVLTNASAPMSHSRHVTDMGRAASSLAPMSHRKHMHSSASTLSVSPLLMSNKGPEMPRPPKNHHQASPNPSFTFSDGLESNSYSPMPQQILTPRPELDSVQSSSVPTINIDTMLSSRLSPVKVEKSPSKRSRSTRASKVSNIQREGSPLPQQILTPRDPDPPKTASPYGKKRGHAAEKSTSISTAASLAAKSKSRSMSPSFQNLGDDNIQGNLSDC